MVGFQYVSSIMKDRPEGLGQVIQLYNDMTARLCVEYGEDLVIDALHKVADDVRQYHLDYDEEELKTPLFLSGNASDEALDLIDEDLKKRAEFYSTIDDVSVLAIGYVDDYNTDTLECLTSLFIEVEKAHISKKVLEEVELAPSSSSSDIASAKEQIGSEPFCFEILGGRIIASDSESLFAAFEEEQKEMLKNMNDFCQEEITKEKD